MPTIPRVFLTYLIKCGKPFLFVFQLLYRIFWSGLNERNIFQLTLNFWINFSPVFIWLLIFKNAGLIPKKIRPAIHVRLPYRLDNYMFNGFDQTFGSCITVLSFAVSSYLLYNFYYKQTPKKFLYSQPKDENCSSSISSIELEERGLMNDSPPAPGDFQDDSHIIPFSILTNLNHFDISKQTSQINDNLMTHIQLNNYTPLNCWDKVPPILLCLSWIILNIDFLMAKSGLVSWKDNLAWFSYVLGHFLVPLFTAIYLYVFQTPGSLQLYGIGLGLQNIAGVMTHLLFPCAPPWFITLYGEFKEANYDMPGYAAGLTRVKYATGTHLVDKGFHASPIVFGAVPSLHSAMAVMSCFFLCYYARWTIVKVGVCLFVVLQWWATIYLDHHWRLDLLVGLLYSITVFTMLKQGILGTSLKISKKDEQFYNARLNYDFKKGSTMGMRVFRNTKLQNFFDPLLV